LTVPSSQSQIRGTSLASSGIPVFTLLNTIPPLFQMQAVSG
jgi:hypothetical protein